MEEEAQEAWNGREGRRKEEGEGEREGGGGGEKRERSEEGREGGSVRNTMVYKGTEGDECRVR